MALAGLILGYIGVIAIVILVVVFSITGNFGGGSS
jgi:hypothetical protein